MGPSETEARRIAAVLSSAMPKGFRCRFVRETFSPAAGAPRRIRSGLHVERFDGAFWNWVVTLAAGDAPDLEDSAGKALKAYSEKEGWTRTVRRWNEDVVLKCPPAGSAEELVLKLDLMESGGGI